MPSPYLIVAIQFTLGLIIFGTAFGQYVLGRLQSADVFLALGPVLLIQGFRFLGLTMLALGQVAAGQNMGSIEIIAYGDLAAAVTGVIAALAAYRRSSFDSVKELVTAISAFIHGWNDRCHPFTWTKTADEILAHATRQRNSDARH